MRTKRNGCMEFAFNNLIVIIEFSFNIVLPSVQMTSFRKDIIFDVTEGFPFISDIIYEPIRSVDLGDTKCY